MTNEEKKMPMEIDIGWFYAPAPMSEYFYSVIDADTKMTPESRAKYHHDDKFRALECAGRYSGKRRRVMGMVWLIWIVGAMFTDGLKDPMDTGGFREVFERFFVWPWELGQFVRLQLDGLSFALSPAKLLSK